jgi:hypothetical protein
MKLLRTFFNDRRGVGAIDYAFVAALTFGLRDLASYGAAIKLSFGMA